MTKNLKKAKSTKKFKKFQKWSFGTINIRAGAEKDDGAKIYSIA